MFELDIKVSKIYILDLKPKNLGFEFIFVILQSMISKNWWIRRLVDLKLYNPNIHTYVLILSKLVLVLSHH